MHGFDPRYLATGRKFPAFLRSGMKVSGGKPKLGPELVTNPGPYANTTGWTASTATLAAASSRLRVTGTSSGAGRADQQITCIPQVFYEARIEIGTSTSTNTQFRIGTAAGGTQILSMVNLAAGVHIRRFRATQAAMHLALVDGDSTGSNYAEYVSVSVKRVLP